ncbi:gp436 family protein [Thauera butanivorans]|uniref:gp436 family protein n=1 Tax=Thauera butanivorans TaxID=86174 RepID=UPI003AB853C2
MSYATQQAMVDTFGQAQIVQVTSRGGTDIDTAVLARAFEDADQLIDSYLAERYALPLAGRAFPVRQACDIAMYYLLGTRVTESAQTRYEQALGFLRDVARGVASLPSDGTDAPAQDKQDGDLVQSVSSPPVFSADALRDY